MDPTVFAAIATITAALIGAFALVAAAIIKKSGRSTVPSERLVIADTFAQSAEPSVPHVRSERVGGHRENQSIRKHACKEMVQTLIDFETKYQGASVGQKASETLAFMARALELRDETLRTQFSSLPEHLPYEAAIGPGMILLEELMRGFGGTSVGKEAEARIESVKSLLSLAAA